MNEAEERERLKLEAEFLSLQARRPQAPANRPTQPQAQPQQERGLLHRLGDNLIGYDDGVYSPGERAADLLNAGGESASLGIVGEEATARADQLLGRGSYDERLQVRRGQEEHARQEMPLAMAGAELAGALAVPGTGAAGFIARGATRGAQAARAGLAAGAGGAVYGFAEGEDGPGARLVNSGLTAALSAPFGYVGPRVVDAVMNLPRGLGRMFQRASERPSVETLQGLKNAAYRAVEDSGERFTGEEMQGLSQRVSDIFANSSYVEDVDTASRATLRILERNAGQEASIGQLDRIRQGLWARYNSTSDQPQILDAIGEIDNLIASRSETSELMAAARAANSLYAKSQLFDRAFRSAEDRAASAGSGGNVVNQYRQAVRRILDNRREIKFFSQAEQDLMRTFVRGTTTENMQRLIGKLSPNGNGLMMALHIIGGVSSGGASLPIMAVGDVAKRMAERSAVRGADGIRDMAAGQMRPAPPPIRPALAAGSMAATPALEDAQGYQRNRLLQ